MYKSIYLFLLFVFVTSAMSQNIEQSNLAPGVIRLRVGTPDQYTPYSFCVEKPKNKEMETLGEGTLPFSIEDIKIEVTNRGCEISIPMEDCEQLYGFGLQIGSFQQKGLKKKPIVNDNPLNDLGYTHAPQPFYVSTKGYGILVNTLRYPTFYCGSNQKRVDNEISMNSGSVVNSTDELYRSRNFSNFVYIDVPNCKGIELFVFKGTNLKDVVQRYNLFSGGGCLPPIWGLGLKYRVKGSFTQDEVLSLQKYFRNKQIPCDVIGLEPGWQTAVYSCSYIWNKNNFPNHIDLLNVSNENHFKINLWKHAYVHPTSPLWGALQDCSGDFLVWNGLVPDFSLIKTRQIFENYFEKFVKEGISGFKLDECDNSDISKGNMTWGFPDMSAFPSGLDGEQMHQIFGTLYFRTMNDIFKKANKRSYQDYRSSGLFVSSFPGTIYSDIYGFKDYVQMICNSAFGGLLWSPEVRESNSKETFFHRLQVALLSANAVINSWYLENPPWLQYDTEKNNAGVFLSDSIEMENSVRKLINTRMQLIPYIYTAFAQYNQKGIPVFRPLVMDWPEDERVWEISDEYLIGDNLLVAPLLGDSSSRKIYFPKGRWYNFNTNEVYEGGKSYEIEIGFDEMPLFVKDGTILPLAAPVQYVSDNMCFDITCNVYGDVKSSFLLYEDDGISYDFQKGINNWITLQIKGKEGTVRRLGTFKGKKYEIKEWRFIQ